MEFLICLLIAAMIRPASDMYHAAKGIEPPHLTKARLAANRVTTTSPATRSPVSGRGTFGDVWAAYWGGAMADIAAHRDRVRAEKKAGTRPPLVERVKRAGKWVLNGSPKHWANQPADPEPATVPVDDPLPTLDDATPPDSPARKPSPRPSGPAPFMDDGTPIRPAEKPSFAWDCSTCGAAAGGYSTPEAAAAGLTNHPCNPPTRGGTRTPPPDLAKFQDPHRHLGEQLGEKPLDENDPQPVPEGDDMPETTPTGGTATGDAHDVETAIAQCAALDDDLTSINTALDVIDENIDTAGKAAELIEAFLASKNVDDAAVGGMSVARDMLSPTHIKALMDAIAAAKQGVRNAMEELLRLQELEQQLKGADGSVLNGR